MGRNPIDQQGHKSFDRSSLRIQKDGTQNFEKKIGSLQLRIERLQLRPHREYFARTFSMQQEGSQSFVPYWVHSSVSIPAQP